MERPRLIGHLLSPLYLCRLLNALFQLALNSIFNFSVYKNKKVNVETMFQKELIESSASGCQLIEYLDNR